MTHDQIRSVLLLCKEHGVRSIKIPELEAVFEKTEIPLSIEGLPGAGKMPSEEEFLFAAVDYDPNANKDLPRIQTGLQEEG